MDKLLQTPIGEVFYASAAANRHEMGPDLSALTATRGESASTVQGIVLGRWREAPDADGGKLRKERPGPLPECPQVPGGSPSASG
jgi:hypothetical protein